MSAEDMGYSSIRRPSLGSPFSCSLNGPPSPRLAKYRTEPCRNFALGSCIYGDRCSYLHTSPSHHAQPALSQSQLYQPYAVPFSPTPCFEGYSFQGVTYLPSPPPEHISGLGISPTSETPFDLDGSPDLRARTPVADAQDRTPPPPPSTPVVWDAPESPEQLALSELSSTSTSSSASSPRQRRGSKAALPHRGLFYRTKPCRFYHETGSCIKGSRCNFIHDGYLQNASSICLTESRRGSCASTTSVSSDTTSTPSAASPSRRQRRAASKRSTSTEGNFYPVTWRVIGGGVLMGGKRDICTDFMAGRCAEGDDCKFAHPETYGQAQNLLAEQWAPPVLEEAPIDPFSPMPYLSPVSPMGYYAPPVFVPPPPAPTPPRRRAYALQVTLPERDDAAAKTYSPHRVLAGDTLQERTGHTPTEQEPAPVDEGLLSPGRFLVRPMSTPPTPSVREAAAVRLFNAESP